MPSTSKAQHNAMEAAAHGKSSLGIPKKVAEEFVEADAGKAGPGKRRGKFKRKGKAKSLPTQDGAAENDLGTSTKEGY